MVLLCLKLPIGGLELLPLAPSSRIASEYSGGGSLDAVDALVLARVRFPSWLSGGVTSVLSVTSTSSASRYHFRRRVYLPQLS
jgi:hypothetical protein